jgi:hypothetical protein
VIVGKKGWEKTVIVFIDRPSATITHAAYSINVSYSPQDLVPFDFGERRWIDVYGRRVIDSGGNGIRQTYCFCSLVGDGIPACEDSIRAPKQEKYRKTSRFYPKN